MLKRGYKRENSVIMLSEMRIYVQFLIIRKMNNILHDIFSFEMEINVLQDFYYQMSKMFCFWKCLKVRTLILI